ncbi:MAG: acyl-CoA thioesterase II [Cellvibrionaceae bacterium]|nr:acyl-CoA thioesterase II [Cellvibrionaceae bacterium]
MSDAFAEKKAKDFQSLLEVLRLEKQDDLFFRGHNMQVPWGRVYGGQVLAQALYAAHQTVSEEYKVHSQHAYFIRPGQVHIDIDFKVEIVRDGRGFCTRRVTALQNGKAILISSLSFQRPEDGLEQQCEFQADAPVEGLQTEHERQIEYCEAKGLDPDKRTLEIEYRSTNPFDHLNPAPMPPRVGVWMRASGKVDDPILNQALLSYMSDSYLLDTSLLPHGISYYNPKLQSASLDHALWFYDQIDASEWHYYELDSPKTSGARGLNFGKIYRQDGCLVAAAAQECLMRMVDSK